VTEEEIKKAMHAAAVECGRKGADEHDQAAWAASLNQQDMDLNQALAAIAEIGADPNFVERAFKHIGPGAVVVQHRRRRERRIRKAGLIPAPPNPDDAQASIAHQRAITGFVASGQASPSDVDPTGRLQAAQRRVDVIRRHYALTESGEGAPRQEPPATESGTERSRMLEQVRSQCRQASERLHSDPPAAPEPAPPAPAPAPAPGRVRRQTGPTQAGDALRSLFGPDRVPDWIDDATRSGQSEDGWCGRCQSEDGTKITVQADGQQVRIQCCAPERASA